MNEGEALKEAMAENERWAVWARSFIAKLADRGDMYAAKLVEEMQDQLMTAAETAAAAKGDAA